MTTRTLEERQTRHVVGWLGPALAVVAALVLLYAPVVRDLIAVWSTVPYYSYGFLVPPWSAWLVVAARSRVAALPVRRDVTGLAIAAAGLGVLALAGTRGNLTLAVLSLPVVLTGLGRFALGREAWAPLAFPVGFLALMAPLPPALVPPLSERLQQLAAWAAAGGLSVLGIPFWRDGVYIHLASAVVHISEWCNGLRFLLAMAVLGVAFGWTTDRGPAVRLLVFALAVSAAIVANLVRVASTTVLVHFWGPVASIGLFHSVFGKAIYLVTLGLVLLAVLRLRK
jgi:exosortase